MNIIHVKNMVCPRCIVAVEEIFNKMNIATLAIDLGEIKIEKKLSEEQKSRLKILLQDSGFELLTDINSQTIERIKNIIIEEIHYPKTEKSKSISMLLSSELHKEYSSLSKLFSAVEGKTIERYVVSQKIEKVKELLFYKQLTLSEIAIKLHYSSTAHLSAQFKKETGMTPTAFSKMNLIAHGSPNRKSIDSV